MPQSDALKKAMLLARNEVNLSDDERQEFASEIVLRDVSSWSDLSDEELGRVLDALRGFQLVVQLKYMRPQGSRTAAVRT